MTDESMKSLFVCQLSDILSAEMQLVEALPELIEAADSKELKQALEQHLNETREQVKRLKKVFKALGTRPSGEECEAMQGLIQECREAIECYDESPVRDAAIIAKAQCVEHYEISAYGTLRTFAKELGFDDIRDLLQETLDEESNADKTLNKIAEGGLLTAGVNYKAIHSEES